MRDEVEGGGRGAAAGDRRAPGEGVFSPQTAERVLAEVARGASLRAVARQPGMPHRTTLRNWANARPAFGQALAEAMQAARLVRRRADRDAQAARAAAPAHPKASRASTYTPALGEAVCARIAGGESVVAIGRDPAMPAAGTIYGWVRRHPAFEEMYVQARRLQADYLFDEAREVALAATPKSVWADRLRFDVIRWQTARLAPRKYAEPLLVQAVRDEPPEPIPIEVRTWQRGPDGRLVEGPPEPRGLYRPLR